MSFQPPEAWRGKALEKQMGRFLKLLSKNKRETEGNELGSRYRHGWVIACWQ